MTVEYKLEERSPWEAVKLLSRAGKAAGKYSNCWNTKNSNNFKQPIDFSKTASWKNNPRNDNIFKYPGLYKSPNETRWSVAKFITRGRQNTNIRKSC